MFFKSKKITFFKVTFKNKRANKWDWMSLKYSFTSFDMVIILYKTEFGASSVKRPLRFVWKLLPFLLVVVKLWYAKFSHSSAVELFL